MALEQHAETFVSQFIERLVNAGFAAPFLQRARKVRILRRMRQRLLVGADRAIDFALVIRNLTEKKRRRCKPRHHVECLLQRRHGFLLLSLRVRSRAGTRQQYGIVWSQGQRFGEEARGPVLITIAERLPASVIQFVHPGLTINRRHAHRHHEQTRGRANSKHGGEDGKRHACRHIASTASTDSSRVESITSSELRLHVGQDPMVGYCSFWPTASVCAASVGRLCRSVLRISLAWSGEKPSVNTSVRWKSRTSQRPRINPVSACEP